MEILSEGIILQAAYLDSNGQITLTDNEFIETSLGKDANCGKCGDCGRCGDCGCV